MNIEAYIPVLITVINAATPLLLAALGELVVEKSGVLNLGLEGMMLMGAVAGFSITVISGSAIIGILAAIIAGALMAFIFGFLTLTMLSNQVATGLALTLFGVGFSALIGVNFVGTPVDALPKLSISMLTDIPVLGPLFFGHDAIVYFSILMVFVINYWLYKTRAGLKLRAVGESHEAAHALGHHVIRIRYLAVIFGGMMAGLAGAFLSLSYTPMWVENMSAGRGWIALALVVFASWKTGRVLLGAYLFGGITIMQLFLQGMGVNIPPQILSMLPYLVTILVLVLISRDSSKISSAAPASLGKIFHPTQ